MSTPVLIAGLGMMALAGDWAQRAGGAALVLGASVALATQGGTSRAIGWSLALIGAPIVAALVSAL